ncbi:Transporter permease domain protein (plasmid) [Candidatus Bealeia paramacronuclearis]|uniref:Transporter permease domain protein n=1 Tax=Candidatus Bealeia paramacronuclearis TaxID=1921001 RepID=A0ABZ2C5T7_9PROT
MQLWFTWTVAAIVPGLVHLSLLPYVIYKIYPPHIKKSPDAVIHAQDKLKEMGDLKSEEWIMLVTFLMALLFWMFSESWGIEATTTAIFGISILLFTGVLDWKDVIKEHSAWETMLWFAPLLMMATFLTKFGMMSWFSDQMQASVSGFHWGQAFIILSLVYFYSHYGFASITARVTALYSAFLVTMIALGTPPMLAAMSLAILSNLAGTLTHFGTGSAPIFFGAGYVSVGDWWRLSFILSLLGLTVWGIVGGIWWKVLGYW